VHANAGIPRQTGRFAEHVGVGIDADHLGEQACQSEGNGPRATANIDQPRCSVQISG
jgi:hypothetical protein